MRLRRFAGWALLGVAQTFLFSGLSLEGAPAKGTKPKTAIAPAAVGGDSAGGAALEEAGEPAEPIAFSGIWMAGREEDWERRFPVAKDVVMLRRTQADGFSKSFELSKALLNAFQASKREGGNRIVDGLTLSMGSASSGRALVMACSINHEYTYARTVGVGRGAVRTVFADVFADLLVCDFADLSVVARFPFRVTRKDIAKPGKSDRDVGVQLLSDIYSVPPRDDFTMGGDKHRGMDYWTSRKTPLSDNSTEKGTQLPIHLLTGMLNASKHGFKTLGYSRVAVRSVNVMSDAEAVLHSYFKPFKEEYFASLFSSNFYDGTGLATLPYSKGNEVIFSMMVEELSDAQQVKLRSGREAESKNVKFSLARSEYDIDLVIPTFMTVPRGDISQCCAYSRITVKQNDIPIYSVQHDANQQMIAARGTSGVSWEAYADATCEMFFRAGPQMLKAVGGKDFQETKPIKIIMTSRLRKFFFECAPDTIKNKQK
jgi:hypothetical protein